MNTLISASVLGADILNLASECRKLEEHKIDMLHFDVMDGHFVNNISFGLPVLSAINKCSDIFLDVHLMISDPFRYISEFVKAGSDMITFHLESDSDVEATIGEIKKAGVKVGLSVKPGTPVEDVYPYLDKIDMVLIMTVEPGFGGQGFIHSMTDKIKTLKKYISDNNIDIDIEVDGGINASTAPLVKEAGANVLVSGSYLFNAASMEDAVSALR